MSDYITIELSKYGKHKGKYKTIVSIEDAILADFNWSVSISKYTDYAVRKNDDNAKPSVLSLHREVMRRILGYPIPDGMEIDHIDGNGLNNTRDNLRLANKTQNGTNRGKNKNNTSGYKGVIWSKQKERWFAQIWVDGKRKHLGSFKTKEDAHKAYCKAADKYHGEFANFGD